MNANEFNLKYKSYLELNFYGLIIENKKVIKYLDRQFKEEIEINPLFTYAQVKIKFGFCSIHANTEKSNIWENEINNIINDKK